VAPEQRVRAPDQPGRARRRRVGRGRHATSPGRAHLEVRPTQPGAVPLGAIRFDSASGSEKTTRASSISGGLTYRDHERAKRQCLKAGIGYRELSNGFASRDDPAGLQKICDALQPGTIEVFAQRWLHRLPLPFSRDDERAGYWWELSMRQVEVSRTIVLDAPRRARAFFEALIADNLDIGRPANVELIFNRHIRRNTPGRVPHRHRPARHRPRYRRGRGQRVL